MLSTLSTSVSNLISSVLHTLRFSYLFPALIFTVLNEGLVLSLIVKHKTPHLLDSEGHPVTLFVFATVVLTVLIGHILNTLNFQIIQLFEGYPFRLTLLGRAMTWIQLRRMQSLKAKRKEIEDFVSQQMEKLPEEVQFENVPTPEELGRWILSSSLKDCTESETAVCGTKLTTLFPSRESAVTPTALGNAVACFEEYPRTRYGIEAVFLWPRLTPILSEQQYAIFVEKEKANLDFLLNLSLLVALFGIEAIAFRLIGIGLSALYPLTAFAVAYLLYRGAIQSACNWGETVRVAFDTYRYHLANRLAMKPFCNKEQEFTRWEAISQFIVRNEPFSEFNYPLPKDITSKNETG